MATCPSNKIDSNVTGLRFAWERCLKELWPNPVWNVLEPNSYSDFGATVTTVARNPINPSRQRKKGTVTDLDAAGGFNQDLTQNNLTELAQSFFFADARQRATTRPLNAPDTAVTGVTAVDDTYAFSNLGVTAAAVAVGGTGYRVGDILTVTGGTGVQASAVLRVATINAGTGAVLTVSVEEAGQYGAAPVNPAATSGGAGVGCTVNLTTGDNVTFPADALVLASGFGAAANNGIKTVVSMVGGDLTVAEALTDEAAPPATAVLEVVGHQFDAGDLDVTMNGGLVRLESATVDLTTLGLIPGEWIFVGGDLSANRFDNNVGFGRVSVVAAGYIELDKVDWDNPVAEDGAAKSIRLFFGTIIKNESDPALIVRKTLQLERTLGNDINGTMSEYLVGAIANELTLNAAQAAIATVDLSFVGCDVEHRTGLEGLKTGSRPALVATDAFNTTDNFSRIKLSLVDPASANVQPLFAFCTDLTLTINNNVTPNKAIGILGAFDTTAGTFEVGGELTAYFADVAGPQAVRANSDATIDYVLIKGNAGIVWDMPLIALGNGAIQIEADQPIVLPLETNAAESKFGHTLLMQTFNYLPSIASA